MAQGTIQVTPDMLRAKANDLRNLKSNHDENMTRMRTLITSLNEIWKGDAQDAFLAGYENMQGTFAKFSQMLEEYAKLMDDNANSMQQYDAEQGARNTSAMSSFGV